jgi:hypothetical protein
MVATYTTNLRITKQGTNDNPNTWGEIVNDEVIALFDEAISGVATVNITGSSNYDISVLVQNGDTDVARHAVIELTGVLGANISFIVPSVEKVYFIRGAWSGAYTVTVIPAGGSSGIVFNTGESKLVYTNGTNIHTLTGNNLLSTNNLSDLTNVTSARNNLGLGELSTMDEDDLVFPTVDISAAYPVGSIYINGSSSTNPGTLFGFGTWVSIGQGRVLVGVGTGVDTNGTNRSFTNGATGGRYTHVQTVSEMPVHNHNLTYSFNISNSSLSSWGDCNPTNGDLPEGNSQPSSTFTQGGGSPMDWMQPYIAVHMWIRTV